MQDVKFFGLNRKNNASVAGVLGSLQTLPKSCPVKAPYTYSFTCEEASRLETSSFPWPVLARVLLSEDKFTDLRLLKTFSQFTTAVKEMNNLKEVDGINPILLISRPPIKVEGFENLFYYLATNFIAVHNTKTDELVLVNVNAQNLFSESGYNPEYVYRIVRADSGFIIEGIIKNDDPRLDILKQKKVEECLVDNVELFRNGYRNGYFHGIRVDRGIQFGLGQGYVGDVYNFGLALGYNLSSKLRFIFEKAKIDFNGLLTREHLINIKLNNNDHIFDKIKDLIWAHNGIQTSPPEFLGGIVAQYLKIGDVELDWNMVINTFTFLTTCLSQKGRFSAENNAMTIMLPDSLGDVKVHYEAQFKLAQYRIRELKKQHATFRIQVQNPNIQQFIRIDEEPVNCFSAWCQKGSFEIDCTVRFEELGIDPVLYAEGLKDVVYQQPSTYSGSARRYAALTFKDEAFCIGENGMKLIGIETFRKFAAQYFQSNSTFGNINLDSAIADMSDDEGEEEEESDEESESSEEDESEEEESEEEKVVLKSISNF